VQSQKNSNPIQTKLSENIETLHRLLPLGKSFDLMTRELLLGTTQAYWLGLNGFCVSLIVLLFRATTPKFLQRKSVHTA